MFYTAGMDTRSPPGGATATAQSRRRSYADGCAAAHALDLIGERWALLVVRELLLGPRRFSDLRTVLRGISPNVLTQRLADLEAAGVLFRKTLPPPAACQVYALTPWGKQLETVLLELLKWGVRSPEFQRGEALTADALALSFKAMFDPGTAIGFGCRITFIMDRHTHHVEIGEGRLAVARGEPPGEPADAGTWAAATLRAVPVTVLQLAYGGRLLAQALAAGDCRVEGDIETLRRFLRCFKVPAALCAHGDAR